MNSNVFIGLGSNVGDRESYLNRAIQKMGVCPEIEVIETSQFLENRSKGPILQPEFINAVIKVNTIFTPEELLGYLQKLELELGRTHKGTYGPRTIDLDILFFSDEIVCQENLTVPHPLLHEREFVLVPLYELAPDWVHPVLQESIKSLYLRALWGIYQV